LLASTPAKAPEPAAIKRLAWMRRIHVYSPKAARMLVLFSYDSLAAWALAESCPLIEAFCEYPGYVKLNGARVIADLWVSGCGRDQFVKIEGGIELSSELPDRVPTYTDVEVARVSTDWLLRYQVWIDNWLQINPYLVANSRFVTPAMLDRVAALFDDARPLFDAEHAVRDVDAQLARTAVFMLMHKGTLSSDDLMLRPLASTTVFRRSARQRNPRSWPA
jgi:hypothetical protein